METVPSPVQDRVGKAVPVLLLFELGVVEVAVAHYPEDLEDADQGIQVDQGR
jgi:hypothetical protein